jgi:hypothetical protein
MEDEVDRIVNKWKAVRPDLDTAPAHVLQRITRAYGLQSTSFNKVFARYGLTWGEHLVLAASSAGSRIRTIDAAAWSS